MRAGHTTSRVFVTLALASAAFYGAADFLGGIASKRARFGGRDLRRASGRAGAVGAAPAGAAIELACAERLWVGRRSRCCRKRGRGAPLSSAGDWHDVDRRADDGRVRGGDPGAGRSGAWRTAWHPRGHGHCPDCCRDRARQSRSVERERAARGKRWATTSVGLALISGVAVGLFFLCLARTSDDAGLWPLIVGRSVSVPLFGRAGSEETAARFGWS